MKALRTILAVLVIGLLAVSIGCSKKKDNPTAPTTTTQLPAAQQTTVATLGQSMATQSMSGIGTTSGFLDGVPKGGKTPPNGWYGPDAGGWYHWYYGGDSTTYYYTYQVKLTPDVWGAGAYPVTKVEWKMTYRDTTTYNWWFYAVCNRPVVADSVISGTWEYHFSYIYSSYNLSYNWVTTYDNVSLKNNNYSGHYTFACNWPYVSGTGSVAVNLTGEFTFIADGSGTGKVSADGVETVRYVFTNRYTGYYTLLSENWATQHPFNGKK